MIQRMKRVLMIVLDSVGCGDAPDAAEYGDEGADTLGHLFERVPGFDLPHLASLGLYDLLPGRPDVKKLAGAKCARLTETSAGKDTTTGHWELLGRPLDEAFALATGILDAAVRGIQLKKKEQEEAAPKPGNKRSTKAKS